MAQFVLTAGIQLYTIQYIVYERYMLIVHTVLYSVFIMEKISTKFYDFYDFYNLRMRIRNTLEGTLLKNIRSFVSKI